MRFQAKPVPHLMRDGSRFAARKRVKSIIQCPGSIPSKRKRLWRPPRASKGGKNKKPGLAARAFFWNETLDDQAAGLNSFDALALIGSTVSVATFWVNSASSLEWAVRVSNCFLACEVHSSIASDGDFTPMMACAKS